MKLLEINRTCRRSCRKYREVPLSMSHIRCSLEWAGAAFACWITPRRPFWVSVSLELDRSLRTPVLHSQGLVLHSHVVQRLVSLPIRRGILSGWGHGGSRGLPAWLSALPFLFTLGPPETLLYLEGPPDPGKSSVPGISSFPGPRKPSVLGTSSFPGPGKPQCAGHLLLYRAREAQCVIQVFKGTAPLWPLLLLFTCVPRCSDFRPADFASEHILR